LQPLDITAGPDGALWFTGVTSIGRLTTAGVFTTYERNGLSFMHGITAGPRGTVWFTDPAAGSIGRIATPAIKRLAPRSGAPCTTVVITGYNLSHATQVAFNGTLSTIVSDSATKIVTTVPVGATTGPVSVTIASNTAISSQTFKVTKRV